MSTLLKGREGEAMAAELLRKNGYKLIGANYRSRFGEIDLIAQKKGIVVFVEVKLRKSDSFAAAYSAVTPQKQKRLILTAEVWSAENNCTMPMRFDIIEIYTQNGQINHIENAFS